MAIQHITTSININPNLNVESFSFIKIVNSAKKTIADVFISDSGLVACIIEKDECDSSAARLLKNITKELNNIILNETFRLLKNMNNFNTLEVSLLPKYVFIFDVHLEGMLYYDKVHGLMFEGDAKNFENYLLDKLLNEHNFISLKVLVKNFYEKQFRSKLY